jgi:vacuolar-type H+-ATPase subunit E/Vma4
VSTQAPPARGDPLQPLIEALLGRARRDAAELLGAADADARATLAQAHARAGDILADARAKGQADADVVRAGARARAEREARAILLAAQERALEEARREVRHAVRGLRDDPAYPEVLRSLGQKARAELGEAADVRELPSGGIEARLGDRRVEYSLEGLADDLLEQAVADPAELWAP